MEEMVARSEEDTRRKRALEEGGDEGEREMDEEEREQEETDEGRETRLCRESELKPPMGELRLDLTALPQVPCSPEAMRALQALRLRTVINRPMSELHRMFWDTFDTVLPFEFRAQITLPNGSMGGGAGLLPEVAGCHQAGRGGNER